ncbi:MAG: VOC family protein [Oscillatoria sp. PMC 1068.18]|nr:VOC family protein [Oscillatoria sp. PMC 1076.18]MEC4987144.1 VOC family protein [Oscillatoria sp. PMC 1068.18]
MNFRYQDVFVTLAAVDLEILVEFYRQLLNQDPQLYFPQVYAEFQLKGLRLGIFHPKANHDREFADSTASGMSLCFEVENLETAIASLDALGFPPPGEITLASHGREIYAYDPAGNRLILHQFH